MNSRLEALERLAALRRSGALTQSEFELEKASILGEASSAPSRQFQPQRKLLVGGAIVALAAAGGAAWVWSNPSRELPDPQLKSAPSGAITPEPAATIQPEPVDVHAGAKVASCRQDVCSWEKVLGVRTVKRTEAGTLKVEESYQGSSKHRNSTYPEQYDSKLPIEWEQAPVSTYVFCSTTQPGLAFRDRWSEGTKGWIGHLLDPFDTYGYNYSSARTYVRICHNLNFERKDIREVLLGLGYRPGTRNEQVTLQKPADLIDSPAGEAN